MGVYAYDGTTLTPVAGGSTSEDLLAPVEASSTSAAKYEIGEQFIFHHVMYEATATINIGDTITVGTNCKVSDTLVEQIAENSYESKSAASGGTDLSLVTTGEKYNWNGAVTAVDTAYQTGDTAETTIDDADYVPFYDTSATAKRKSLWSNIKIVLKTYFDTLYSTVTTRETAASGGTTLSLVTTGEKYTWNGKQDAFTEKTATLEAGETSVTFTQIPTSGNYLLTLFSDSETLEYNEVDSSTAGSLTYTFDEQEDDVALTLKIEGM